MKKVLIGLAALASATIVSCQKDYVISSVPQEQPIEFSTYLGRNAETKGTVLNLDALKTQGFGVLAYNTGTDTWPSQDNTYTPDFMYNQEVTYDDDESNSWTYSPTKYWPNETNNKISFFAYAPYDDSDENGITLSSNSTQGDPTLTYTLDDDIAKHVDVCFAVAQKDKEKTAADINFAFYHALAKVGFKVQALVDERNANETGTEDDAVHGGTALGTGTTITLKELKLKGNFYKQGTLNLATSTYTTTSSASTNPSWSPLSGNDVTTIFTILTVDDQDEIAVTTTQSGNLGSEDEYLMIFPQEFGEGNDIANAADHKITVSVVYDVKTTDSQNSANSSTVENTIEESFNFTFEAGKGYTFCLHIGMQSINFSAEVTPWDEQSGTVVNVPINPVQN